MGSLLVTESDRDVCAAVSSIIATLDHVEVREVGLGSPPDCTVGDVTSPSSAEQQQQQRRPTLLGNTPRAASPKSPSNSAGFPAFASEIPSVAKPGGAAAVRRRLHPGAVRAASGAMRPAPGAVRPAPGAVPRV